MKNKALRPPEKCGKWSVDTYGHLRYGGVLMFHPNTPPEAYLARMLAYGLEHHGRKRVASYIRRWADQYSG